MIERSRSVRESDFDCQFCGQRLQIRDERSLVAGLAGERLRLPLGATLEVRVNGTTSVVLGRSCQQRVCLDQFAALARP